LRCLPGCLRPPHETTHSQTRRGLPSVETMF
jgi:hypothetical protein